MREYLYPNWPAPTHVRAVCTTRVGGMSHAPYHSFNMGYHVGDNEAHVAQNLELLQSDLALVNLPRWLNQTHSNIVIDANENINSLEADGVFTQQKNVTCAVLTADCLPILLCNKSGTKVAALHGGWRGLARGIIENALTSLQVNAEEWMAWLGPAIGPTVFEVGEEVREQFVLKDKLLSDAFVIKSNGKFLGNLALIAQILLESQGVRNVYNSHVCTVSDDRFYSYRRDQGKTGRMASIIWIA